MTQARRFGGTGNLTFDETVMNIVTYPRIKHVSAGYVDGNSKVTAKPKESSKMDSKEKELAKES